MDTNERPVLSRSQAVALAEKVLTLVRDRNLGVQITHSARAETHIANGRVLRTDAGDVVRIGLRTEVRPRVDIYLRTNQLTDVTLKRALDQAAVLAPVASRGEGIDAMDYSGEDPYTYGPQSFLPVSLWHPSTVTAMETARAETIPTLVHQVEQNRSLSAAATVSVTARATCLHYHHGLTAFAEETDAEVTVTARTKDGTASGWNGQAHRDWAQLTPSTVAVRAMDLAERSHNPVAFEPGRRTVILSATAVGQLVRLMAPFFSFRDSVDGVTPFSSGLYGAKDQKTKRGLRVVDPLIMMASDPADPMGGFPPFTEEGGYEYALLGFPVQPATWIDHGILTMLARGATGQPPCDLPRSVRLFPAPGTVSATIDDMIANCAEGIYINRFSNLALLAKKTGMITGTTRDGCFLVKQGKIIKALKNFRFVESPVLAFNRLEMIGMPERVALSQEPATELDRNRWPYLPIIAPPMMIRDFNLTGLSDAV